MPRVREGGTAGPRGEPLAVEEATAASGVRLGHRTAPSGGADAAAVLAPPPSTRPRRPAHSRTRGRALELELEEPTRPGQAERLWRKARWTFSTLAVAGASFFMGVLALWAASWITHASLAGTAMRWDGTWYYRISELGYTSALPTSPTQSAALRPAFFPGLPILEHAVHAVVGGVPAATSLPLGAVGLVVSCFLIRALVTRELGAETAWKATVIFAFFPGAYVFFFGYSELLEIPLALLALYALRRRWYLVAGVATAAATGTRLLGVALVVACAVAAAREVVIFARSEERRWSMVTSAVASPVIGLGGLAAFMIYLQGKTGNARAFEVAERMGWNNTVSFAEPFRALQEFFQKPLAVPFVTVNAAGVVVLVACLVLLAVKGLRRLPLEETAYAAVILLAWLFTSNTGGWFRFVLSAFPVITLLALWLDRRWYPVVACAGAALCAILIVLFGSAVAFSP